MEKREEELIGNDEAEQRAIKVRKVLTKTKEWGQNLAAMLLVAAMGLAVILFCVAFWKLGLGFIVIIAAVVLAAVGVWVRLDHWTYNELEKARHRRYKETQESE